MTKSIIKYLSIPKGIMLLTAVASVAVVAFIAALSSANQVHADASQRLVTIHDGTSEKVIVTQAETVAAALKQANISLDTHDDVEPGLKEALVGTNYTVNIYRAQPVIIEDGALREKIMTSHQTAGAIVADAGLTLHNEDKTALRPSENIAADGASVELVITRATPLTLVLYGKATQMYAQAKTVGGLLQEKGIKLSASDYVSAPQTAPITANMTLSLWRNGEQTVTEEQAIPFTTEKVYDMSQPIGYIQIQTPGIVGKRDVTYQVNMQSGAELSRTEIQNVVILQPIQQVEVVGLNPGNGLSRNKGANFFTDSKGVTHRETYYNLPMQAVMSACGGSYSVRPDGVKVDQDGYILIAANLAKYPRCSVVETSLGPGKVYDTGGFVARYPDGFDIATDW